MYQSDYLLPFSISIIFFFQICPFFTYWHNKVKGDADEFHQLRQNQTRLHTIISQSTTKMKSGVEM